MLLKPIKTVKLKTVGLWIGFARRITAHAANIIGSYDLSESELVFAMGTVREKEDLMSALDLMDKVLELIKRGFDRHANALTVKLINNIGIILGRGGFSYAYSNTVDIYNRLSSVFLNDGNEADISGLRKEIQKQRDNLKTESAIKSPDADAFVGTKALNIYKEISEHRPFTLNTLNSGILRMSTRNPELLKIIGANKSFLALSVKNVRNLYKRTERSVSVQRFLNALTKEQTEFLERFVVSENLFSELRENEKEHWNLKFLLENSSEKSLSNFFEILRNRIREQNTSISEKDFFDSTEEMKNFFVGATREEILSLIRRLREENFDNEAETISKALQIHDTEIKIRDEKNEKSMAMASEFNEFEITSEAELQHIINTPDFSEEHFIKSLKESNIVREFFINYAWENYRTEETLRRYSEYHETIISGKTTSIFPDKASEKIKENFADFLINSGELSLKFSEGIKKRFLGASSDVNAAFAEYLVNNVREDSFDYYNDKVRTLAEKAENILYRQDSEFKEKSSKTFSLIRDEWDSCGSQLWGLYADFMGIGSYDEIITMYSQFPKTDYQAVSQFFSTLLQNRERYAERFDKLLSQLNNILAVSDKTIPQSEDYVNFTFYDAIERTYEGAFGTLSGIVHADKPTTYIKAVSAEQTAALVVSASFLEYLSENGGKIAESYVNPVRELTEKIGTVLHNDVTDIRERTAEAFELIYSALSENSGIGRKALIKLYDSYLKHYSEREKVIEAYSKLPNSNFEKISKLINSYEIEMALSEVSKKLLEHSETLTKNIRNLVHRETESKNGQTTNNSYIEETALIFVAAAFSEFFSHMGHKGAKHYGENIRNLAEQVEMVLHDEQRDIRERAIMTYELIYNVYNKAEEGDLKSLSKLYDIFMNQFANRQMLYRLYMRLPENDFSNISVVLNSAEGEKRLLESVRTFSKPSDRLLKHLYFLSEKNSSSKNTESEEDKISARQVAELVVSAVFAEYLYDDGGRAAERYIKSFLELTEEVNTIIHSDKTDIYERTTEALKLIYNIQNNEEVNVSEPLSELYENFAEHFSHFSNDKEILELYSKLPKNDFANISMVLTSTEGKASLSKLAKTFSEATEGLTEQLRRLNAKEIVGTSIDLTENITSVNQAAILVASAAFAEYLSNECHTDAGNYSQRVHELSEQIKLVLHNEQKDIHERTAEALKLIYNVQNNGEKTDSESLSRLYDSFAEHFSTQNEMLRLYSHLPKNHFDDISVLLSNAEGEKRLLYLAKEFSESSEKMFEHMHSLIDERLFSSEMTNTLASLLPNAYWQTEQLTYNILHNKGRIINGSIAASKNIHNLVAEYESNLDGSFSRVLNQELYTVLASDEYIFALNNESVTRFNRTVSDKIHRRTNSFSGRHKNFIEALPERITEKNSEMYQYSENNSASELFYTEEYLESRGGSNVTINYAIPAASQNSSSDDVPDKLRELHNKVESINSEVESIKHSENQLTKEFVTKSEQQIFERELKNGIEQDIYLAGKRHGIY